MKKVLVVDDEPFLLNSMLRCLRREPYDVLPAGSASEAIKILKSEHENLGLLVTDIKMPIMDGVSLALWTAGNFPSIPIVALTGYPEDDRLRSVSHLLHSVLPKPWDNDNIRQLIRSILQGAGS